MSKTVDELCDVFGQASGAEYERWLLRGRGVPDPSMHMRRAGIAAVVRALRDEMRYMMINRDTIDDMFNEILGSDAGEKVAGGSTREDGPVSNSSTAETPATDPAPAVCEWHLLERKQGIATWSSDHRWHAFFAHEKAPLLCDECGKPIKFTEAQR